jgi:hypothetical protein
MKSLRQCLPECRPVLGMWVLGVSALVGVWLAGPVQGQRSSPQSTTPDTSAEHRAVKAAVSRAAQLLKDQKHEEFIEEYFPVDRLRAARAADPTNGVQRVAQSMQAAPQRVQKLIELLERCESLQPSVDRPRGEAVFVLAPVLAAEDGEEPSAQNTAAGSPANGLGDDLSEVLKQAAELLRRKAHADFVTSMFPVKELDRIQLREGGMDEILLVLEQQPQMVQAMLQDLEELQTLDPAKSEADLIEFELPPPVKSEPPRIVRFQLVGGNWRCFDNSSQMRAQIRQYAAGAAGPAPGETTIPWERIGQDWRLSSLDFLQ